LDSNADSTPALSTSAGPFGALARSRSTLNASSPTGASNGRNVHHFNEDPPVYEAVAKQLKCEKAGRAPPCAAVLHEISGDDQNFSMPTRFGERLLALVTWSRVMGDHELLPAINTDENHPQEMWTTLNPNQRIVGEQLELLFSYAVEHGVENLASMQYAPRTITVGERNDVICARLKLGPAGFGIYSGGRTKRRSQ